MSKELDLVRKILETTGPQNIESELPHEFFFTYGQHTFSISQLSYDNGYRFRIFRGMPATTAALAKDFKLGRTDQYRFSVYDAANPVEEKFFGQLYKQLRDKVAGIDDVFDDLLD